jgi:hypothetical protein
MMFGKKFVPFLALALLASPAAFAKGSALAKACKSDLKKFGCAASTDAEAHECLEKNEVKDAKHEGFSAKCYKANEAFEKKSGKEEKEEQEEAK